MQYFSEPKKVKLKNGGEIIIRRPKPDDALKLLEYLAKVSGESDNLLIGEGELSLTEEQERRYVENANNDKGALLIIAIEDEEIVSICNIKSQPQKRVAHNSEVGISVRKSHWRQGIGEIMLKELIAFARAHEHISIVSLGVRAQNSGAIKLYEKLGFERIGVRKDFFKINGAYYDEILMDLYLPRKGE